MKQRARHHGGAESRQEKGQVQGRTIGPLGSWGGVAYGPGTQRFRGLAWAHWAIWVTNYLGLNSCAAQNSGLKRSLECYNFDLIGTWRGLTSLGVGWGAVFPGLERDEAAG